MNTIGWLFILSAFLLIRQVSKGRVMNIGEDLSDMFIAIASGDTNRFSEILSRTGEASTATQAIDVLAKGTAQLVGGTAQGMTDAIASGTDQFKNHLGEVQWEINHNIALWAIKLGTEATGYRFGATGPKFYDCSGLMWRACQKVGYKGPRFVTATVSHMPGFVRLADPAAGVSQATTGDLVVWPGKHMGVITTPGKFYSALNPKAGILEREIKGFRKENPDYLRFVVKR